MTVVAQVLSIQPQTTNCIYLLNDGTANMEARQWVDANTDDENGSKDEIKLAICQTSQNPISLTC